MRATAKENPRQRILEAAAAIIHKHGYQGMSIGDLLKDLGISKGALYHHFSSKREIGYAVLDEICAPAMDSDWQTVFTARDPLAEMERYFLNKLEHMNEIYLQYGCPVNNLAQEMSPLDEGFKERTSAILTHWRGQLAAALARGQVSGTVDPSLDPAKTASLIVASTQGMICLVKNAQDPRLFKDLIEGLIQMLHRFRPA